MDLPDFDFLKSTIEEAARKKGLELDWKGWRDAANVSLEENFQQIQDAMQEISSEQTPEDVGDFSVDVRIGAMRIQRAMEILTRNIEETYFNFDDPPPPPVDLPEHMEWVYNLLDLLHARLPHQGTPKKTIRERTDHIRETMTVELQNFVDAVANTGNSFQEDMPTEDLRENLVKVRSWSRMLSTRFRDLADMIESMTMEG